MNCTKKESAWATPKWKANFFGRINKSRSSSLKNFLFYQISSWLSYESFFCFASVMLFVKKGAISARRTVERAKKHKIWPNLIFSYLLGAFLTRMSLLMVYIIIRFSIHHIQHHTIEQKILFVPQLD